jgi:hypothetical protein
LTLEEQTPQGHMGVGFRIFNASPLPSFSSGSQGGLLRCPTGIAYHFGLCPAEDQGHRWWGWALGFSGTRELLQCGPVNEILRHGCHSP